MVLFFGGRATGPLPLVPVRNYQQTDDSDLRRQTGLDELWLMTESERPKIFRGLRRDAVPFGKEDFGLVKQSHIDQARPLECLLSLTPTPTLIAKPASATLLGRSRSHISAQNKVSEFLHLSR